MRRAARRTLIGLGVAALAVWAVFHAGTFLQHEDPLRQADAIYVLAGARIERALEAADLFRDGVAPVILLSAGREEPAEAALRAKGIPFPREADPVRDALAALGVPRPALLVGERPASASSCARRGTTPPTRRAGGASGAMCAG